MSRGERDLQVLGKGLEMDREDRVVDMCCPVSHEDPQMNSLALGESEAVGKVAVEKAEAPEGFLVRNCKDPAQKLVVEGRPFSGKSLGVVFQAAEHMGPGASVAASVAPAVA